MEGERQWGEVVTGGTGGGVEGPWGWGEEGGCQSRWEVGGKEGVRWLVSGQGEAGLTARGEGGARRDGMGGARTASGREGAGLTAAQEEEGLTERVEGAGLIAVGGTAAGLAASSSVPACPCFCAMCTCHCRPPSAL